MGYYKKVKIHGVEGGIKYEEHIFVPADNYYPDNATLDALMRAADEHAMQCRICGEQKRDIDDPENTLCAECEEE